MTDRDQKPTAVITGASSGIGKASALALGQLGWRVICVGRDPKRCAAAQAELDAHGVDAEWLRADFDSMAEVKQVAAQIRALTGRIDALVNNAGGVRDRRYQTVDGLEATFAANHLAPFLLTRDLLPVLIATARSSDQGEARVIAVSSSAHEYIPALNFADLQFAQDFSAGAAYCQAKLANLLFTRALWRRYGDQGIVAQAMHPGVVESNFYSHGDAAMRSHLEHTPARSPQQAARTIVMMATAPECGAPGGRYFHDGAEVELKPHACDDVAAQRLWVESEVILERLSV